jgi:hypothetical protein
MRQIGCRIKILPNSMSLLSPVDEVFTANARWKKLRKSRRNQPTRIDTDTIFQSICRISSKEHPSRTIHS